MKNYVSLFLLLLLMSSDIFAAPRTREQAKAIAEKHTIVTLCKAESRAYYIFDHGDDNGFVIVSADDRMPDIIGYTNSGTFDERNIPVQLKAFLDAYTHTFAAVAEGNARAADNVRKTVEQVPVTTVQPLLGDIEWNQGYPYNLMCPEIYGDRALTGCSATAAAQIMRYHRFPLNQAEIPGYTTSTYKIKIPAISASTSEGDQYDWDNMLPSYTYSDSGEECDAVAKLVYHVGVAMKMDYGPAGSDADYTATYSAFSRFGYDTSLLQNVSRSSYSHEEWLSIIMRELNANRPIFYCGQSPEEGHSFVCDGIDSCGLVHINWGWGGRCNGYYDINVLNPYDEEGGTDFGGYCGFNMMVVGITPENSAGESKIGTGNETTSEWDKMDASISCSEGKLYYNASQTFYNKINVTFENNGKQDFYGSAKIVIQTDEETSTKTIYNYIGVEAGKSRTYTLDYAVSKKASSVPEKITFYIYKPGSVILTQQTFDVEIVDPSCIDSTEELDLPDRSCYDLQGIRTDHPTQGIYIRNRKKLYGGF